MKILLTIALSILFQNALSGTLKCIGNDITFNGLNKSNEVTSYWEDFQIDGDILSIPKYGDFIRRSENSAYWLNDDNWAKIDPDTGKFTVSIQKKSKYVHRQIQGKCTKKNKKLY